MGANINILWLEEDPLDFIESAIRMKYTLQRSFKISDAIKYLEEYETIDILLLDIMIPLYEDDEKYGFNSVNTLNGTKSGYTFFKIYNKQIKDKNIKVIVYSILGDDNGIKESFVNLGLNPENYLDKIKNCKIDVLLGHIEQVINEKSNL
jgi:hypothetical protein